MYKINIAIVDDEELMLELLHNFFQMIENFSVVITCNNYKDFLNQLLISNKNPDIVLFELRVIQINIKEILAALKQNYPEVKIIVISYQYKEKLTGYMLKSGVNAFIPKDISPKELVNIIKEVVEKDYYFMDNQIDVIRKQLSSKISQPILNNNMQLTGREIEVLSLICQQKTAKDISEILCIAKRTVDGHRTNLLLKTGAKNTAGLVIYAIQNNLIDPIAHTAY